MRHISALAAALLALAPAASAGTGLWTDPRGDAQGGPDVTSVGATTAAGILTFTVHTAAAMAWDGAVAFVQLDTVPGAGDATGADDTLTLHSLHDTVTHERWDGHDWVVVEPTRETFTLDGATLTIAIPLAELGEPKRVSFVVQTRGQTGGDDAPDRGVYTIPNDARLGARFAPAIPRHGAVFAVSQVASCTVTLGLARLAGGCRPRLPAGSRGKVLTVVVRGQGLSRTYRFTVR